MKAAGAQYLVDTLRKPMGKIIDHKNALEVDPNKATKDLSVSSMKKNFDKLLQLTELVLDAILAAEPQCPKAIKQLFKLLSQVIGKDHPDKIDITIGGFIFLRFFCPAVVSPEGFELAKAVPPPVRKNLVLISKTLQNMASGTEFGANEPYMLNANQFLRNVKPNVHTYLQTMSTLAADDFSCLDIAQLPTSVVNDGATAIYYLMHQSAKKIEKLVAERGRDVSALTAMFAELGEPIKPAKQTLKAFILDEVRRNVEEKEEAKKGT
eukprot:Opistho-2@96450